MIEKVRLKAQIIWYFPSIVNVVKITLCSISESLTEEQTLVNVTIPRQKVFPILYVVNVYSTQSPFGPCHVFYKQTLLVI